jgi:protein ImuB
VSIYCCVVSETPGALERVARACSPRVDPVTDRAVLFDAGGLGRAIGPPEVIAREVATMAAAEGLTVHVAIASSMTAAWILAQACHGITVALSDGAGEPLAPLPLRWLETLADLDGRDARPGTVRRSRDHRRLLTRLYADRCAILRQWGLATVGDVARLDRADLHARLGPGGVRLHQAARGEDARPLGTAADARPFVERIELEWPIDGLEPLAFVLARPTAALCAALERADRGAVTVTTTFGLVTRELHTRVLHLPTPLDDAAVLRTLVLLDLEAHPPSAAIDVIELTVEPAPRRILQRSLLDRAGASPEEMATLVARLGALMGETRVGHPILLDTDDARAVAMAPWPIGEVAVGARTTPERKGPQGPVLALRRFRLPIAARVTVVQGAPARVVPAARDLQGGDVVHRAGPWRTSGHWWTSDQTAWDRDEWDVELTDGAVYRLARDRATGAWVIEGLLD